MIKRPWAAPLKTQFHEVGLGCPECVATFGSLSCLDPKGPST